MTKYCQTLTETTVANPGQPSPGGGWGGGGWPVPPLTFRPNSGLKATAV